MSVRLGRAAFRVKGLEVLPQSMKGDTVHSETPCGKDFGPFSPEKTVLSRKGLVPCPSAEQGLKSQLYPQKGSFTGVAANLLEQCGRIPTLAVLHYLIWAGSYRW